MPNPTRDRIPTLEPPGPLRPRDDGPPVVPMSRPGRYLMRMSLFVLVVGTVAVVLLPAIQTAFLANPALNGLILFALLLGILFIFRQVLMLGPEVRWLEAYQAGRESEAPPRLLAAIARMFGDRSRRISLSAVAARSLLDGVGARLDESREISRYLIGLLIFLGLLGTFWGLLQTVAAIGGVIGTLSFEGGDMASVFADLQRGLQAPLSGMGTAFSSSLFGLSGSLVLGFLELQAGQAQNRFYTDLEDWLAGVTRLTSAPTHGKTGEVAPSAYLQALLEQTAENIERLQYTIAQAEDGRRSQNANLTALVEKLGTLTDQMRAEQSLMRKLAENQLEMRPVLQRLADALSDGAAVGLDEASRAHLRNLDIHAARLLEESDRGRAQSVQEIRSEIKLLARTIGALAAAREQPPPPRHDPR